MRALDEFIPTTGLVYNISMSAGDRCSQYKHCHPVGSEVKKLPSSRPRVDVAPPVSNDNISSIVILSNVDHTTKESSFVTTNKQTDRRQLMTTNTTFPIAIEYTQTRSQAATMKTNSAVEQTVAAQQVHKRRQYWSGRQEANIRRRCHLEQRLYTVAGLSKWLQIVATCCFLLAMTVSPSRGQTVDESTTTRASTIDALGAEPALGVSAQDAELLATTMAADNGVFNSTMNNQTANKLKPVNFTLIDEVFESVLTEDEVVKRWRQMDSQLQDGMKSILKMLFPQIVALSQDAKVSGECSGGILKWILSLRNLRSWAIKSEFRFLTGHNSLHVGFYLTKVLSFFDANKSARCLR